MKCNYIIIPVLGEKIGIKCLLYRKMIMNMLIKLIKYRTKENI